MTRRAVLGQEAPLDGPLVLDAEELTYLLELIGTGTLPAVLGWRPVGDTVEDRGRVCAGAARRLADRRLATADGGPHRDLLTMLRTATSPRWSLEVRVVGHVPDAVDARACLCGNDIDDPLWIVAGTGSVTVTRLDVDAAGAIAAWIGDAVGAVIDPVVDDTDVVQAGLEDVVPHCRRHTEIVGLRHDLGVATTIDPSIALYDSDLGRVIATTAVDPTGRSRTSVRSGTRVRTVGAVRSSITSLERRSVLDEHLVHLSGQPIGSSGVRLPFVSNGGV